MKKDIGERKDEEDNKDVKEEEEKAERKDNEDEGTDKHLKEEEQKEEEDEGERLKEEEEYGMHVDTLGTGGAHATHILILVLATTRKRRKGLQEKSVHGWKKSTISLGVSAQRNLVMTRTHVSMTRTLLNFHFHGLNGTDHSLFLINKNIK